MPKSADFCNCVRTQKLFNIYSHYITHTETISYKKVTKRRQKNSEKSLQDIKKELTFATVLMNIDCLKLI